jgi:serine/threonine-protein kinase RIM15
MPGQPKLPYHDASPSLDGLLPVLQEIITLATDIQETSVNAFIAKPACCREFVAKVRRLGVYWDENPSWPGREWFVRLLLAVASLSRVVEWWEAESIFWNFGDDELENEPLTFVMKPARDLPAEGQRRAPTARPTQDSIISSSTQSSYMPMSSPGFGISQAESTPASERPGSRMAMISTPVDDLQLQAEHAKSVNIVLELSLGGEIIEWVNPAWEEVLG